MSAPERGTAVDHLEVWLDFVCPWCYIAESALLSVLTERRRRGLCVPRLRFRSYILEPRAAVDPRPALERYLALGVPREKAERALTRIVDAGLAEGIHFDFERGVSGPTLAGHRLLHAIQARGLDATPFVLAVFRGYFEAGKAVSDPAELLAAAAGMLDPVTARAALDDPGYDAAIAADQAEADASGLRWIPYLRFADGRHLEGRLGRDELRQELEKE
ncbi:MAG: DsbA family protein [Bacillota bacterium]|nr:DsbA family protein [Bacillota bacterium]